MELINFSRETRCEFCACTSCKRDCNYCEECNGGMMLDCYGYTEEEDAQPDINS